MRGLLIGFANGLIFDWSFRYESFYVLEVFVEFVCSFCLSQQDRSETMYGFTAKGVRDLRIRVKDRNNPIKVLKIYQ